ncbi:MAG: AAA family ATPase [Methylobacterium sp.]|uniref:YhaN family protein n=1 Tax=Methylobacterium sp. TaxID=409 RepID=UPI0025DBE1EE|nr:YhaN family protein [Methylobacterium sp.]MBX9932753.1 AAA family ATPase [Methylobacterium sp.]
MRLCRLDLERYGPFSDRSLVFRPGARLHVVLGPNEAGKSSALAALTDLLFGIEVRTRYAFRHEMSALRLGAEIEAGDGRRLAFRRRKGSRNTLVDAADGPLPEDALVPYLGALSREVFCRAFGLDARSLRQGGQEMLTSDGEVGASLFAAASGLRGYHDLQKGLGEEAERIFAPRRAKDRAFYQALDRYEAARKAIRETELRTGDWRDLNDEIAAAAQRLDAIRKAREGIAGERARLERLKRVSPLVAEIDAVAAEAEADSSLVEASPAWIDRLGEALGSVRAAETACAETAQALAEASAELDAVAVDPALLPQGQEILDGFRGIDRFDKDGIDLPRIQGEADRAASELDRLAVRIGVLGRDDLASRQPSDAVRARIEALIRDGRERKAALARLTRDRAEAQAEQADLAREQQAEGPPLDPAPLRAAFKAFAPLRDDLARRDALEATIRHESMLLAGQAARMIPGVADAAGLSHAPLPSPETVARYRALLEGKERERERALDACAAGDAAVSATETRLRRREAGRPIPSRAELDALRLTRDGHFAALRAALFDRAAPLAASDIAGFERAMIEADRVADDLAADAARVAEQATDRQRLGTEQEAAAEARAQLARIEAELAEGLTGWCEVWVGAGIAPLPPAEMLAWLGEATNLIEGHQALESRRNEVVTLSRRIDAVRAPLSDLARRAGLDGAEGFDPGLLLTRLEDRITALAAAWETGREAQARLRAANAGLARLDAAHREASSAHAAWLASWDASIPAIGLSEEAGIEEAESALEAWRAVPSALRDFETATRRVAGILRDREVYRDGVTRLLETIAPDLLAMAPSAAIRTLHERLQRARDGEVRRLALTRHRDEAARRAEAARNTLVQAGEALIHHLAEGGVAPSAPSEVAVLHGRLGARARLRAELAARRAELTRAAGGIAEADLRAELAAMTPDEIEAALVRLAMEEEGHDQDGRVVFADRDKAERRRAELEGGTGAELALAQRKAAEAELQAAARAWSVLRLAQLMLGSAIARHRAGQQDPLLARAGDLFSGLTGGSFDGLAQDYDEADIPRLTGRRPDGERVAVDGMSEGTRDQLYLALRLSYLQDYAARGEPAPFVGDDLFLTFDDARTGHGLEALASIGETIQPILFTHHAHVVDIARARLGEAVDIVTI